MSTAAIALAVRLCTTQSNAHALGDARLQVSNEYVIAWMKIIWY